MDLLLIIPKLFNSIFVTVFQYMHLQSDAKYSILLSQCNCIANYHSKKTLVFRVDSQFKTQS